MAKDAGEAELSAKEAAALLDVKLPTLYAYVSRGLLRSIASPDTKRRRYRREDVVRLKARHAGAEAGRAPVHSSSASDSKPVPAPASCTASWPR